MGVEGALEENKLIIYKSVRNQRWCQRPYDSYLAESLRRTTRLPEVISNMLSRYVSSPEDADQYINPTLKKLLPDPYVLKDMDKAVDVVVKAIKDGKKIVVFGDYDVDGATSSAVIKKTMEAVGCEIGIYIPDRIKEGYGPNINAIQKLKESGYDIIITVDCGSSAHKEVEYAKRLGFEVIILDHHKCSDILPNADALVNPNRIDDQSGYGYLAAVGVSFLFAVALHKRVKKEFEDIKEFNLLHLLDLVALGTVCDVVPLIGVNRAFVRQGLKVIMLKNNIGLSALIDVCGIAENISVYHLGFIIGPRINAGGRVGESYLGSEILTSNDYEASIALATTLDMYNQERKEIELSVLEEATKQAASINKEDSVIVVNGDGWHQGVIGIVAGRLKEMFHKPVAVISFDENHLGKASCRSIEGIDFGAAVIDAKKYSLLQDGGGHAMAAGFSIARENLDKFKEFLVLRFAEDYKKIKDNMVSYYAATLSVSSIDISLINHISSMGPFGSGNAQPRFLLSNIVILYPKILKDSHISCIISGDKNSMNKGSIRAIAFSVMQNSMGELLLSQKYELSLVVTLDINRWQGSETPQLVIQDMIMS